MTTSMIIATVIECAVGIFLIWGIFNEDKLCDFEDAVFAAVKRYFRRKREEAAAKNTHLREA